MIKVNKKEKRSIVISLLVFLLILPYLINFNFASGTTAHFFQKKYYETEKVYMHIPWGWWSPTSFKFWEHKTDLNLFDYRGEIMLTAGNIDMDRHVRVVLDRCLKYPDLCQKKHFESFLSYQRTYFYKEAPFNICYHFIIPELNYFIYIDANNETDARRTLSLFLDGIRIKNKNNNNAR